MALLSLIVGNSPERVSIEATQVIRDGVGEIKGTTQVLEIETTMTEEHRSTVVPTDHPIEEGTTVADHVQIRPDEVTIEGVISEAPLTFAATVSGLATAGSAALGAKAAGGLGLGSAIGTQVGAIVGGSIGGLLSQSNERIKDHLDFLRELQKKRIRFDLVTKLHRYRNMILTELQIPRDATTGRSLRFIARMREIQLVKSDFVFLPEASIDASAGHSAAKKNDNGKQTTQDAAQSAVSQITDIVTNTGTILYQGLTNFVTGG